MIAMSPWKQPETITLEGTMTTSENPRMKLGIILPEAEGDFAGSTAG